MAEIKQIWRDEDKMFYPEIKEENGRLYKLDKETFVYLEQLELGLTAEEPHQGAEGAGTRQERREAYLIKAPAYSHKTEKPPRSCFGFGVANFVCP